MTDRLSTQQAAEYFNVSERTIRRWIKEKKVKAELEKGRWFIHIDGQSGQNIRPIVQPDDRLHEQLASENQLLRDQLNEKDQQIGSLIQQLDHSQQIAAFSQKNVTMLSEQLNDSRQMIEDMRQRQRRTVWQRLKAVFVAA